MTTVWSGAEQHSRQSKSVNYIGPWPDRAPPKKRLITLLHSYNNFYLVTCRPCNVYWNDPVCAWFYDVGHWPKCMEPGTKNMELPHHNVLVFDVASFIWFGFNCVIPMVKVLSECQSSRPLMVCCVTLYGGTKHWLQPGAGWTLDLPHGQTVECFLKTLLKAHFQADSSADRVSGTNKHDGSPESIVDKRSEAATNRGRGLPSSEGKDERGTAALDRSGSLSGCVTRGLL